MCTSITNWAPAAAGAAAAVQRDRDACLFVLPCFAVAFVYDQVVLVCLILFVYLGAES
jgi:hypothetical protein